MKKRVTTIFTVFISLLIFQGRAQDSHFTLFTHAPLFLNPSLTGVFDFDFMSEDLRVASIYRQQWTTVSSPYFSGKQPYHNTSISIDGPIKRDDQFHGDFFGLGGMIQLNEAGDLNYSNKQVNLSASFHKVLDPASDMYLVFGAQAGVGQRSIDYENGFFDNQWTGTHFDPNLPTGENFQKDAIFIQDYSFGVSFQYFPFEGTKFNVGYGYFHANRPQVAFYEDTEVRLAPKNTIHAFGQVYVSEDRFLMPQLLIQRINGESEVNAGLYFKIDDFDDRINFFQSYQFGGGIRLGRHQSKAIGGDAAFIGAKFRRNAWIYAASYDINLSGLAPASSTVGSFELSLIFYTNFYERHKPHKKRKAYRAKCPTNQRLFHTPRKAPSDF